MCTDFLFSSCKRMNCIGFEQLKLKNNTTTQVRFSSKVFFFEVCRFENENGEVMGRYLEHLLYIVV